MAEKTTTRDTCPWNAARQHYQQVKARVEAVDSTTPLDDSEDAESELENARRDFLLLPAPTLSGVCERIELYFGESLFDEDDGDMDALCRIIGNLRIIERAQALGRGIGPEPS